MSYWREYVIVIEFVIICLGMVFCFYQTEDIQLLQSELDGYTKQNQQLKDELEDLKEDNRAMNLILRSADETKRKVMGDGE